MTQILFQLNLAQMRAPFNDPIFDTFKAWLKSLHLLAENHPGFVWRMKGEQSEAGYIQPIHDEPLVMGNMSAWKDYDSLYDYTFTDGHLEMMKNKRKWFEQMPSPYNVLYYGEIQDLQIPPAQLLAHARCKLSYLNDYGESPLAFGFGSHRGKL